MWLAGREEPADNQKPASVCKLGGTGDTAGNKRWNESGNIAAPYALQGAEDLK